jgi:hypothetical protein
MTIPLKKVVGVFIAFLVRRYHPVGRYRDLTDINKRELNEFQLNHQAKQKEASLPKPEDQKLPKNGVHKETI